MGRSYATVLLWMSLLLSTTVIITSTVLLCVYDIVRLIQPFPLGVGPTIIKVHNWPLLIGVGTSLLSSILFSTLAVVLYYRHCVIATES